MWLQSFTPTILEREAHGHELAVILSPIKSRLKTLLTLLQYSSGWQWLAHILAVVAGWSYGCYGSFATLRVLPRSIWLWIRVHRPANLHDQDVETAKTMMLFSVLLALGLITMPGTEISRFPMGVSILVVLLWKWLF